MGNLEIAPNPENARNTGIEIRCKPELSTVKPKNRPGLARPGRGTQKLPYIPLQLSLINFLFTVPVQWPGMIVSASSDFTVCIKGPNIGSF